MGAGIENKSELIQTYLAPLASRCRSIRPDRRRRATSIEPGTDLVVTNDPIIAGVHFFASDKPEDIAWKALAVNVSDLPPRAPIREPICWHWRFQGHRSATGWQPLRKGSAQHSRHSVVI